jgi:hypothetical protein
MVFGGAPPNARGCESRRIFFQPRTFMKVLNVMDLETPVDVAASLEVSRVSTSVITSAISAATQVIVAVISSTMQ